MNKLLSACLLVAAAMLFPQKNLSAQTLDAVILGPSELDLCFQPCGTYQASVVGGTAPFTYFWYADGVLITPSAGGNGSVTWCATSGPGIGGFTVIIALKVLDANGQSVGTEYPVFVNNNALPITGTVTPICDSCSGAITVPNLGTPNCPVTYQWTGPGGFTSTVQNMTNICYAGTYTLTATNCQGCTSVGSFPVGQGANPGSLLSNNPNPCNNPDQTGQNGICEKVCPGQKVTYSLAGAGSATNLFWQITGAAASQVAPDKLSATITWPAAGTGNIFVNGPAGQPNPCGDSLQLCVAVAEAPTAVIASNPKPQQPSNKVVVCENQTVFFENKSLNSSFVEWDFGDFSPKSFLEKPSHAYAVAGLYNVRLVTRSECYCADTTSLEVYVLPGTGPELDCIGTVCRGTEVTYTTNANCGSLQWGISPEGSILSGGGPGDASVTVQWTGGETGQISLTGLACSPALCPIAAVFEIPIISNDAEIRGDQRICDQAEAVYEIAPFGGANFVWALSSGGSITEGQGTNRVKVQWTAAPNTAATHWLSASYDNCYLGCGGQDSIDVKILPQYSATGPLAVCDGATASFSGKTMPGNAPIALDWAFSDKTGAAVFSQNNVASPAVPMTFGTGQFLIKTKPADPSKTCTDEFELSINVVPLPAAPTGILGENQICPGQPYTYEVTGVAPGNNAVWQFTNGSPAAQQGEKATATWAVAGPYSILASQKTGDALGCESPVTSFSAQKLPLPVVAGDPSVCEQTEGGYSATVFQGVDYQWVVSPVDAGSVSDGQGTAAAKIFWHKPGNHSVSVAACGQSGSFPVLVNALPEPVAAAPDSVCKGATVAASTTAPFAQYFWKKEDGSLASNLPSPLLGGGHYEIEVVDANGCRGDSTFFIAEKPLPNVNISTPDLEIICPAAGLNSLTLHAADSDEGFDFQWFMNGAALPGETASTLVVTASGNYHVVATGKNGCSAASNLMDIAACGGGGGGAGPPGGGPPCPDVNFTAASTGACNSRKFTPALGPGYVPGSALWLFGDGASSTVFSPVHTFPTAGFVKNTLIASFSNGATCWNWAPDLIELAADFTHGSPCAGGPIAFTDLTTFVNSGIAGWAWDFGDPSSGAANFSTQKNASHTFSAAGNYVVSLTVTSTSGCTSILSKTVGVAAPPVVTIDVPTTNCAGNALEWGATTPNNDIAEFKWTFGDPASGAANEAEVVPAFHLYNNGGSYLVKLSVKSIAGCRADFLENFTVVPNPLSGAIGIAPPSGKICEGKTATLTAPTGGTSWLWGDGSTANSLIVNEEGNYSLTITDGASGCTYAPADAVVDVLPAPDASVSAIEKDEFGVPIGQFGSPYEACFGDDVFLQASGNGLNYSYSWPSGTTGFEDEFSEERGNLLPVGTQTFTLTITDGATGCTNTAAPFEVKINPVPTNVQIAVSPAGSLCGNVDHTFSVQNPVAGQTYEWNTGQAGAFMMTDEPGNFFVVASNSFGCTAKSPAIFVQAGAPVEAVPTGCLMRCTPDTICWSIPPTVVAWQWFFNGSPIASPNGPQLVATQSGQYSILLTDANGCTATSGPLSLDLEPAYGSVFGQVWSDVNDNGIIDGPDTLVGSMPVQLMDGATVVTSSLSNGNGEIFFPNIPSQPYSVALDAGNLPPGWSPVIGTADASLSGCDDEAKPQLLVVFCQISNDSLSFAACAGDSVFAQNEWVMAGQTMQFSYKNQFGCDSLITVVVEAFSVPPLTKIKLPACAGTFVDFNGQQLAAGSVNNFSFQTTHGCDSLVEVTVTAGLPSSASLSKAVCPGQLFDFQGIMLAPGDTMFVLQNSSGCDSTLTVSVSELPPMDFLLKTEPSCPTLSDGKIMVENITGSGPFDFSLDGGATWQAAASFSEIAAGSRAVKVRDGNGCFLEKTADVGTVAALSVSLEDQTLDCDHLEIVLEPVIGGADSTAVFEWKNADGTVISDAPSLPVILEGSYIFSVGNRCEVVEKTAAVAFDETSIGPLAYLPNAVAPLGSDANREWRPFFSDAIQVVDYQLVIYDRWGNRIFETSDPTAGWDGKYRGKRMRPGVFAYWLEASVNVCRRARVIREKGDITIVR